MTVEVITSGPTNIDVTVPAPINVDVQAQPITVEVATAGIQGTQGAVGPAPNIAGIIVSSSEPGGSASGSVEGDSPDYIINLTIPRGYTGPQGIAGFGVHTGTAPPSDAVGEDGDTYIVTSGGSGLGDTYTKASGTWGSPDGNIRGPAGTSGGTGNFLFVQTTAPTSGMSTNDSWVDSDNDNLLNYYNGSAWTPLPFGTAAIVDSSITDAKIVGLSASKLTGTINIARIGDGTITDIKIADVAASKITGTIAIGNLPVAASGVSSSTQIVRANDVRLSDARTPTAHNHSISAITGTTADRAIISDGIGTLTFSAVTSTELGYLSGVTSAVQTQLSGKVSTTGNETIGGVKTFTSIPVAPALVLKWAGTSSIEMGRDDGVASVPYIDFHTGATYVDYDSRIVASGGTGVAGGGNITIVGTQVYLNGTVKTDVTASRAIVTDGSSQLAASATTSTELGYLSGVTSAVQTQINSKLAVSRSAGTTSADRWKNYYEILNDFNGTAATLTGSMVIQTNMTFGNYMTQLRIRGYQYVTNSQDLDLSVGFYAYSTGPQFLSHGVVQKGSTDISQVRLMRRTSDNKIAIVIDITGGTWAYPRVQVDGQFGFTSPPDSELTGWTVTYTTDLTAYTAMTTPTIKKFEGALTAGTTAQYYRGDKSWQTLDKTAVGLANVLNVAQEPAITAGTTAQYWRGDKTWQTLDKTAVGLSLINNVAQVEIAGTQTVTGAKTFSANTVFTGIITAGSSTNGATIPSGGASAAITANITSSLTSGIAAIGAYVNDGTRNYRAGLVVNDTDSVWGLTHTGSSGTIPFIIKSGSTEILRVTNTGALSVPSTITGTGATLSGLTANRALATGTGGLLVASTVTDTELGYVSGVTSAIQTQLNGKATNTGGGREVVAALSATTGTATGDLAAASVFTVTPTGNITLAFSNVPASVAVSTTIVITQGASAFTVTMPAGNVWMTTAPTQVANKRCIINMFTVNGGTTWYSWATVEP